MAKKSSATGPRSEKKLAAPATSAAKKPTKPNLKAVVTKPASMKPAAKPIAAAKASAKKSSSVAAPVAAPEASAPKKVSDALLKTIERRKAAQAAAQQQSGGGSKSSKSNFGRPPMRRGRRPKRPVEYTPTHTDEDNYGNENEYEGIEYDTGIRFKENADADGFNLDRFEDFDEELNFDR